MGWDLVGPRLLLAAGTRAILEVDRGEAEELSHMVSRVMSRPPGSALSLEVDAEVTPRYGRGSHLEVWNGDECRTLRRGDTIPPNTPHGAETEDLTCLVLDAFHPLCDDYVKRIG